MPAGFRDGVCIQTTSAAVGYTVGQAIPLGYGPVSLAGVGVEVEIQDSEGNTPPAVASQRSAYDPAGKQSRA